MSELLCPGAALAEGTQWVRAQGVGVWLVAPGIAPGQAELQQAAAHKGRDEVSG